MLVVTAHRRLAVPGVCQEVGGPCKLVSSLPVFHAWVPPPARDLGGRWKLLEPLELQVAESRLVMALL